VTQEASGDVFADPEQLVDAVEAAHAPARPAIAEGYPA